RERAADEVDQLPGRIDDLSADGDDVVRSALHRIDERRQPAVLRHRIVVQKNYIARGRTGKRRGDASGEAVVLAEWQQANVWITARDRADAPVGRAVVGDGDHRVAGELLRHSIETSQRVLAAVPV